MHEDDHYATLQVTDTASPLVIRAAYRALAQRYHPDKHPDDPNAAALLQRLNVAYAVLSDPAQRHAYDAHRQAARAATDPPPPPRDAAADRTAPRPDWPAEAVTGTVKGHPFTLRWQSARIIANTVWTETTTTPGRDHVTTYSHPRQQLGFRPATGQDFFVEYADRPIPVALGQAVVLITAQGGRLQQAAWVALWNRATGHGYWFGHTLQSLGKAIRTGAAAASDVCGYVRRVVVFIVLRGYLIQRSGYWLWWLPFAFPVAPCILGVMATRLTRTADAIGWALQRHIAALSACLAGGHDG